MREHRGRFILTRLVPQETDSLDNANESRFLHPQRSGTMAAAVEVAQAKATAGLLSTHHSPPPLALFFMFTRDGKRLSRLLRHCSIFTLQVCLVTYCIYSVQATIYRTLMNTSLNPHYREALQRNEEQPAAHVVWRHFSGATISYK